QCLDIRRESPDQPQVRALLGALDAYLAGLYEPQHNHILDVQALLSPQVCFLVARQDERVLACGAYRRMPGEGATRGQAYGEIKRMMVDLPARGRGVGAALLGQLEARLRDEGLGLALLETGAAQRQAVSLYERCGYVRRTSFAGYPDNGLSLFYQKRLQP
ncbi:MAG TPA: GNAT family N-acetyltransferase, partial [Rubrivivax sp.]|nr:GNAT family N-acetyltransferase [Rubrivivax sp.]